MTTFREEFEKSELILKLERRLKIAEMKSRHAEKMMK